MKRAVTILFFIAGLTLLALRSHATAQKPDILIYKGKKYSLHANPLEGYFKKYPDKRPKSSIISTANWRGYVAIFEIIDSTLFLVDIEIDEEDDKRGIIKKSAMGEVFPGQKAVALDWFNGLLTLPYGQMLAYVHMGYSSVFENYMILEVRFGNLTKAKDFTCEDYIKFKDRQFALFKLTPEYKQALSILKEKIKASDQELDTFMRQFKPDYLTYFIEE